jgi:hypothetical protein
MRRSERPIGLVSRRSGTAIGPVATAFSAVTVLFLLAWNNPVFAQVGAEYSGSLPDTSITPASGAPSISGPSSSGSGKTSTVEVPDDDEPEAPPPPAALTPRKSATPTAHHQVTRHKAKAIAAAPAPAIEPENGKATIKSDSWAYSRPSKSSRRIEQVHAGKFVTVTGLTSSYVRVQLKNGSTAYIPASAVALTRPADKIFQLTADAPVLSEPGHNGRKISEVHRGHDVHVVGLALNYMKIRMRDGVEGYIPVTALE